MLQRYLQPEAALSTILDVLSFHPIGKIFFFGPLVWIFEYYNISTSVALQPITKVEDSLEKRTIDINSFNNSVEKFIEMIFYFKDVNKSRKRYLKNFCPQYHLELLFFSLRASISQTFPDTEIGLMILPISTRVACD